MEMKFIMKIAVGIGENLFMTIKPSNSKRKLMIRGKFGNMTIIEMKFIMKIVMGIGEICL